MSTIGVWPWALSLVLALGAVMTLGGSELRDVTRLAVAGLRRHPAATAFTLLLVVGAPFIGREYVFLRPYGQWLVTSTITFIALWLLAFRLGSKTEYTVDRLLHLTPGRMALLVMIAGTAISWLVLDGIPHVSDEIAYQFEARAMAQGVLAIPAPMVPEAFTFTHTLVDGNRWYGIMNPGWSAILAVGYFLRVPWLMTPVLGAATVLLLAAFYRAAGFEKRDTTLAVLLVAVSPFFVFMNGTFMAHPANLLFFALFAWAWARLLASGLMRYAVIAGLALALNLLVRPLDTVAVVAPFGILLLLQARRRPALLIAAAVTTVMAALGPAITLGYNAALTGDALEMPMTRYFDLRAPGQRFGLGFGADMGTTLHGPEWPGYTPTDAPVVTAHRLTQLLDDLWGMPLLTAALLIGMVTWGWRREGVWYRTLVASMISLGAMYLFHFYHGIAYGSRHYYLAIPAVAMALARPLSRGLGSADVTTRRWTASALVALLAFLALVGYPRLVSRYGDHYRNASGAVRQAIRQERLTGALVFVAADNWAWKSAFPLNSYPLEGNDVLFARDRQDLNAVVIDAFPNRKVYYLREVSPGEVRLGESPDLP